MRDAAPVINLKDYTPPAFLISTIALDIDIREGQVTVRSTLRIARNKPGAPLVLEGEELDLVSVSIDARALQPSEFVVDESSLTIARVPDAFSLETVVRIDPWKNTKLEGLYATKNGLVTQCEAEGFRRITYFIDRPDVMSTFAVTLCAAAAAFPRLLANGNLVAQGEGVPEGWFAGSGGREAPAHWARWEDPFPKPSYLFAMVAANLDMLEDRFTTRSGKEALLQIYVEPGKLDQAGFAMQALKKCMRWDEEVFGLEL
ncbi:MAG TPA: aminopeptidase N, partial [Usitatibacter sp.]|nr:aminopeptidase N [Usitatibacter sp.]